MTVKRHSFKVIFRECDHHPLFTTNPPLAGDYMICFACRRPRMVLGVEARSWYWICKSGCDLKRSYGLRMRITQTKGLEHSIQEQHLVEVYDLNNVLRETYKPGSVQLELPDEVSEDHQLF
jgi:hypothetical protein